MGSIYGGNGDTSPAALKHYAKEVFGTVSHYDVLFDYCIDGYASLDLIYEHLGHGIIRCGEPENIRALALIRPASEKRLIDFIEAAKCAEDAKCVPPRGLIIPDFSFPLKVIDELSCMYEWIVICDHHIAENQEILNANGNLPSNLYYYIDRNFCGGDLTLEFLHDITGLYIPRPQMLDYVSDLDLGRTGNDPASKARYDAVSSAIGRLFKLTTREEALTSLKIISQMTPDQVIAYGQPFVQGDKKKAYEALQNPSFMWFMGCEGVPAGYVPFIFGDIIDPFGGRALADAALEEAKKYAHPKHLRNGYDKAIKYGGFYVICGFKTDPKSGKQVRHMSVRSPETGPDAALVASKLGDRALINGGSEVALDKNGYEIKGLKGGGDRFRSAYQCRLEHLDQLYPRYSLDFVLKHPNGPDGAEGVYHPRHRTLQSPHYAKFVDWISRSRKHCKQYTPHRTVSKRFQDPGLFLGGS
jgi:hypothetical protein